MKISTVHHENLNRSSWTSRPFNMKISTVHHENLDHLIWKSRPFVIKSRLLVITSLPFVMKITQFFVQMAFHNWYQNWSLLYKTHWSKFTKTKFLIKCAVQVRSLMECVKLDIFFGSWNLQTKSVLFQIIKSNNNNLVNQNILELIAFYSKIINCLFNLSSWERFLWATNLFFKLSTGSKSEHRFFSFFFQIANQILLNICNMLEPSKWFARVMFI